MFYLCSAIPLPLNPWRFRIAETDSFGVNEATNRLIWIWEEILLEFLYNLSLGQSRVFMKLQVEKEKLSVYKLSSSNYSMWSQPWSKSLPREFIWKAKHDCIMDLVCLKLHWKFHYIFQIDLVPATFYWDKFLIFKICSARESLIKITRCFYFFLNVLPTVL